MQIPLYVYELAKLAQKKKNNKNHSCGDCNRANFNGFFISLGFVDAAKYQNCSTDDGGGDGGVKRDWWYNGRPYSDGEIVSVGNGQMRCENGIWMGWVLGIKAESFTLSSSMILFIITPLTCRTEVTHMIECDG